MVFRFEEFDLSLDYSPETPALRVFVHQGDALKQLDQPFKARDPYAEEYLHWTRLNEVKKCFGEIATSVRLSNKPGAFFCLTLEESRIIIGIGN